MADAELDKIVKGIKTAIAQQLEAIKPDFADAMAKYGSKKVYKAYVSTAKKKYQRRGVSGGLADPSNYEVSRKGLTLTVINNTTGNSAYENSDGWDEDYITDIIESGSGYHWRNSEIYQNQPWERPFMEETGDQFVDTVLAPTLDAVISEYLGG